MGLSRRKRLFEQHYFRNGLRGGFQKDCDAWMKFRKLNAWSELQLESSSKQLLCELLEQSLSLEHATALSYNTCLLFYTLTTTEELKSPKEILYHFSLQQIAELCEEYRRWNLEFDEYGENLNQREELHESIH